MVRAMSEPPRAPEVVEDLALGAFRLVKERLDFELDFTPETLPVLDHFLRELGAEDGGELDEKAVAVVAPCVGAYFGEVCRRSLAGLGWVVVDDDYEAWRLERPDGSLRFNPIGAALEAIHGEEVAGWHGHFEVAPALREAVTSALEGVGSVREDDYFRLAVRHEVLEQTLVALGRHERARQLN